MDEVFEDLRARILHGAWPPGTRLPTEQELTQALGVGRSTVRDALSRLAAVGLVHAPHSGTRRVLDFRDHAGIEVLADLVVSPEGSVDLAVVRAVTEMRAALAPDVARLAALRRTEAEAVELTALAAALSPDGDLEALLEQTLAWWTALVRASGNLAYRLAYNTLRTTHAEGRPAMMAAMADEIRAAPRYVAVARAVAARDAESAGSECAALVALGTRALLAAAETS